MEFIETHHPAAVPFLALCLVGGIRPCLRTGEIVLRKPSHIRLAEGKIRIDGEVSKIREARSITIQPNLAAWLQAYPLETYPDWSGKSAAAAREGRQKVRPHARRDAARCDLLLDRGGNPSGAASARVKT